MANEEQLAILKQGVDVWNKWRETNPDVPIDITRADFSEADPTRADFSEADLRGAYLSGAKLYRANLIEANLGQANLRGADLSRANLSGAKLYGADLSGANLSGANLDGANLSGADLGEANLSEADLGEANLSQADLREANLSEAYLMRADLSLANLQGAKLGGARLQVSNLNGAKLHGANLGQVRIGKTVFTSIDLRETLGLDEAVHDAPSSIGIDTLQISQGKIPEAFLRGCGLSDWEIEAARLYDPDLSNQEINDIQYRVYDLRATRALQISPLFISYSHADTKFVDKIGDCLTQKGIRYWRDKHEMKAGRIETQIDRAIQQNPTVLLVLSKNSLNSDWVEHEVRTARDLAKKLKRDVLCPVALDETWVKESPWPERIMEQLMEYYVVDFAEWQDDSKFDGTFRKLIDGLELFYKK
jgi:uncharacterized protein YjbI with pentapeptide repeats